MSLNDLIAFHAVIHAAHKTALYNDGRNPRGADVSCDIPSLLLFFKYGKKQERIEIFDSQSYSRKIVKLLRGYQRVQMWSNSSCINVQEGLTYFLPNLINITA